METGIISGLVSNLAHMQTLPSAMVGRFHTCMCNIGTYIKALEPLIVKAEELAVEEQVSCIIVQEAESSLDPAGDS